MKKTLTVFVIFTVVLLTAMVSSLSGQGSNAAKKNKEGERLFELETFGGNGRTCRTCHSVATGTVSPEDAQKRFRKNPHDPLFLFDGSDDGFGHGVTRILDDATILIEILLHQDVSLVGSPGAKSVILRRGIPTTLNTPTFDPVLMLDGRQDNLEDQASGAIDAHTQHTVNPTEEQLKLIAQFQLTDPFFSSPELRRFARNKIVPELPRGNTPSERRARRFFEDLPPGQDGKDGLCSACHSGPLLNQTNEFLVPAGVPVPVGSRFQNVLVSFFNAAQNPMQEFVFNENGSTTTVSSPDPGRALITGVLNDFPFFDSFEAFKIPSLRGVRNTAPYFHDNSARTLEDVAAHYAKFFAFVTDIPDDVPDAGPFIVLTPQDQADIVAFLKLLD